MATKTKPPVDSAPVSALDSCKAAVVRAQAEVDRICADKKAQAVDRKRAEDSLMRAIQMLARISGDLELSAATILRSKHWARLMRTLGDALEPFPGALDAAAKALEQAATLQ
jgi:hypothetical protein